MNPTSTELTACVEPLPPGRVLDLACGSGRHSVWLRERGWEVTGVDLVQPAMEGITCVQADLERGEYTVAPDAWDLIVCWLYWQENLLPAIAAGVRLGGIVALAGKTSGRFATSLDRYRRAFAGWEEVASGEDEYKVFFIARRSGNQITEPLRATLTRNVAIALAAGALLAPRMGGLAYWPEATLLMLWPAFGGHWVELWFLNSLRPRLPGARAVQAGARVLVWFVGGMVLLFGMRLTAMAWGGSPPAHWPAWWLGGLIFTGIELAVHLALTLRGLPGFFNSRG